MVRFSSTPYRGACSRPSRHKLCVVTITDAPAPQPPSTRSRLPVIFDRVPTVVYLAFVAAVLVGAIAIFGGLKDGHKTYATAKAGEVIHLGVADVTIDSVRLTTTDNYGDPDENGGEFLTLRVTVTNTFDTTYSVTELFTAGTLTNPTYGVNAIAIDEDLELDYPSIRTASGDASVQLGPKLTQTYDITVLAIEPPTDRDFLTIAFAPSQYTPNKFLRDTSDGYYETLDTIAIGEFAITDEVGAP